jgi:cobalt-zinc-cadmium efflux system outer membrane protein
MPRIARIVLISYILCTKIVCAADNEINLQHLNIQQAQQLFHANSKELLAAQRMLQATEANAMSAAQKPNPSLSIGVSNFNLNRSIGNKNPENQSNSLQDQTLNSTVQISQLFERGDKRELRIASAKNAIQASQFDAKDTERLWLFKLNASYYDLLLAQEIEAIQTSNVSLYEKTLQATELRLKAGDVAALLSINAHVGEDEWSSDNSKKQEKGGENRDNKKYKSHQHNYIKITSRNY